MRAYADKCGRMLTCADVCFVLIGASKTGFVAGGGVTLAGVRAKIDTSVAGLKLRVCMRP
jgi:hypothetical protein